MSLEKKQLSVHAEGHLKESFGSKAHKFMLNVLNGMAVGIVVGLIGNAVLGGLLGFLSSHFGTTFPALNTLKLVSIATQLLTAPLIGVLIGYNFKLPPLKIGCVGLVAYIAAGNVMFVPGTGFMVKGLGDIINILLACSVAVGVLLLLKDRLGSLSIFLLPIIVGIGVGFLSTFSLVYTKEITTALANGISHATNLQPLIAGPIIAICFAFAVSSPLSSVALGLITQVHGPAGAAASVGVAVAASYLIVTSFKYNKIGVQISLFFGCIKMFVPNLVEKPISYIAMFIVAAISGLYVVGFTSIMIDSKAAGFGYISLIGPLNALENFSATVSKSLAYTQIALAYFVVPFVSSYVIHFIFSRVLKLYTNEDFRFKINV